MTDRAHSPPDRKEQTLLGRSPESAGGSSSTTGSLDGGRFAPGTLLEGRYRTVALVGRGGMGAVYIAPTLVS